MKKFILITAVSLFLFPLCAPRLSAQSQSANAEQNTSAVKNVKNTAAKKSKWQKPARKKASRANKTEFNDMRIFVKDGEEAITAFPARALKSEAKITVIFPEGYQDNLKKYPALYIISGVNMDKEQLANILPKEKQNMLVITIRLSAGAKTEGLEKFLYEEILPYFETNYRIDDLPANRAVAAGGDIAANILASIETLSNYFGNFALLFDNSAALPQLSSLKKDIFVWASGNIDSLTRLQKAFEDGGLSCPQNFAYVFNSTLSAPQTKESAQKQTPARQNGDYDYSSFWAWINFDLLFNKNARAFKQANAFTAAKEISLSKNKPFSYWLNIMLADGYIINYVPRELKFAPPYLSWDFENALISVISGAEKGKVKITPLTPLGDGVGSYVKIVK